MANCVILINGKEVDITTLVEQLGKSLDNQSTPELFESNLELANAVYESLGFVQDKIQPKDTINVYWGQRESESSTRILSNLAPRKFNYKSTDDVTREYGSVEHAYQSNKSGTFDKVTYDAYNSLQEIPNQQGKGWGKKIAPKVSVAQLKSADSLGLIKKLIVESFKQNPNSEAAKKLLQYENFTHNTNELIDKAFLEGLKLAQQELLNKNQITSEQKQQAQQLYSSYLQTTNNPTIEEFKEFVNNFKPVDSLNDFNSIIDYAESVLSNSPTNELVQKRLEINKFEDISVDQLMPLDTVLVDGVVKNIDTVEDYYNLKHSENIVKLTRVNNAARNLKPLTISWKENGVSKNLFDLDSVLLKHYIIDRNIKDLKELTELTDSTDKRVILLNAFIKKFNIEDVQTLSTYLSAWTERATQLLDSGLSLKSLLDTDLENVENDLKTLFSGDSLIQDSLIDPEISKMYSVKKGNVSKIKDYYREPMEIILPNNFKQFQIDGHSLSEIKEKGAKFFEDIFKKAKKDEDALTISTRDSSSDIFIYSFNKMNFDKQPHNINLIEEYKDGEKILSYYEGTERIFYIKAAEKSLYRINKIGGIINVILLNDTAVSKIEEKIEGIIEGFFDDIDPEVLSEKLDNVSEEDRNEILKLLEARNNLMGKKNQSTENDSSYIDFIKTFKNINYIIPPNKENKLLKGIANRYYNLPSNGKFDINKISKIQYNSWEKSLEYLASRIPAQSLQSVTSAKAVGFHGEGNIAYISTWMLYIQGADLDIDKAYLMGYSVNNGATMSGDFRGIDLSEKKNFDIAISLPNIRNKKIIFSNSPVTTTEDTLFQDIWNNYDFLNNKEHDYSTFKRAVIKLTHLINASDSNEFTLNVGNIELEGSFDEEYINLIKSINKTRLSKESTETLDSWASIKDELKYLKHIYPWFNVKSQNENVVVGSIHNMIERASNQVALTSPVDNDELAQLEEIKSPGTLGLNPQDGFSIYEQKAKGAMGMSGVGISANQNKTHLAITNELNKWLSTNQYLNTNVLTTKTFHKKLLVPRLVSGEFSDLSNAVVDFTEQDFYTLSDLGFTRAFKRFLKNLYNVKDVKDVKDITLKRSNSMLGISTFISASVDNAKKLFLEKVNASPELLGMHLYLTSIGYTLTESALFMTHSGVLDLIVRNFSLINGDSTEYMEELIEEKIKKSKDSKDKAYWESFKSIYQGAQEFRNLAAIYKINQKMTADIEEIYAYKNKFKIAMFQREHFFWTSDELQQLKDLNEKSEHLDKLAQKILNNIFPNHPKDSKNLINGIKKILLKNLDIIGGGFNIDSYFKDKDYQKRVVEYYNLIKHTENIFDTILSVPHFKARIDAFIKTIYNMEKISSKSKFIETVKRGYKESDLETIRTGQSSELDTEKKIPHYFGNKKLPLNIAKENSSKLSYYFDVLAKLHWAQTSKKGVSKININISEVVKTIKDNLYTVNQEQDPADTIDSLEFFTISDDQTLKLVKYDSIEASDVEINLTSDIGVANFKIFMENLILPYIKIMGKENNKLEKFLNNVLLVKSYSPLGLFTYQIGTYAGVNNAKSEYNRDLADQFIAAFNLLDSELGNINTGNKKLDLRIKNKNEEYLDFRDLFYLYNIFVTNERFGEKTLTATFKEYVGTELAMDWNNFYNSIEEQNLDLETLVVNNYLENTLNISDPEVIISLKDNLRIFYGFQSKGKVKYKSGGNLQKELRLPDKSFPFALSLEMAESNTDKTVKSYTKAFKVLERIKSNILTINIDCK